MSESVKSPPYFFSPSLYTIVAFGHKLLMEKAVEKMNLREKKNSQIKKKNTSGCSIYNKPILYFIKLLAKAYKHSQIYLLLCSLHNEFSIHVDDLKAEKGTKHQN